MFTFIHAADIHLDSPLRGLQQREDAPLDLLLGATRRALENLVGLAIKEGVDFVVLAGDIYDGDWKDYSTGLFFRGQMLRLRKAGIPVYLIAGNHDAASVITRGLDLPDNVVTFSSRSAESHRHPQLPVMVHGRSFPNRQVPENIALDYPQAEPGCFNIGLLHTSLTNQPGHDTYAPCSVRDLAARDYQYWALGHIHLPQVISDDPWIVYSGNTQGRHIREAGPRGCRLVRVDDNLQVESAQMRELAVIVWQELAIDLSTAKEEADQKRLLMEQLQAAVSTAQGRLLVARLRLEGATPLHASLLLEQDRLEADVQALVQDIGEDLLWIEKIKVATTPVEDLQHLAERDELTGAVVGALHSGDLAQMLDQSIPQEISDMLSVLPSDIRQAVESELAPEQREQLLVEVRALIVASLTTGGASV